MERDIKNKTIVVTGAAEGIGYQIVRNFIKAEAKLTIILDINKDAGNKAVEDLSTEFGPNKAVFIKCNVVEDLEKAHQIIYDKFGMVDVLINNAGVKNEAVPESCVAVNLTATIKWSLKFMELMRIDANGNGGTIINIASVFGYRAVHFAPVYNATKFGVVGFTKALGHERCYIKNKVRVIVICPGFTKTNMTKNIIDSDTEAMLEIRNAYQWQSAEEMAEKTVEVFQIANSGTVWEIEGGILTEIK